MYLPTLFVELVDHSDPRRPVILHRSPVTVELDITRAQRSDHEGPATYTISGDAVRDKHPLGLGEVVVVVDVSNPARAWLAEVIDVVPSAAQVRYTVTILEPTTRSSWEHTNADPRWDHHALRPAPTEVAS